MSDRRPIDGMAHVRGKTDEPLLDLTIPQLLAQTVRDHGAQEAAVFVEQNIRWSYADLSREVDRLAGGLWSIGVKPGDRVGIWSPNRAEWLVTQFATARIGAILVTVNPAYRLYELEYALKKVGCSTLITARRFKSSHYTDMLAQLCPELAHAKPGALQASNVPELRRIIAMEDDPPQGMMEFEAVCKMGYAIQTGKLDAVTRELSPHDPINIQFTSGTTGSPKGACLTHHNIVNNAKGVTDTMRFTHHDRLCIPVPFYHCFGMVLGTLGCVTKGATMVMPGEGFDPAQTLQAVSDEQCTALFGVPTMFVNELGLADFDRYDLGQLRTGVMAGASCPIEVMKAVQSRMNMTEITIGYGMTETSPISFQTDVDDPIDKRVSTVGRVFPHVECKIVDPVGNTLPIGEQGELLTRGYSVMRGYWGDDDKTAESIRDGWMRSGDLAVIDADGYCDITGRVKDMILRGGENIYPREIEDFLFTHPDVAQAQVFGIPDPTYGEIVCAWVVPTNPGAVSDTEIRSFCKDNIAHFKVPAHVRIKEALPMTVTGKPQKFVMREEMLAELSAEGS